MYCKNCGHQIHENAQFCQNCGVAVDTPHNNNSNNNKLIFVIIAIVLVLAGGYFFFTNNSQSEPTEQQEISAVDKKEEEIIQGQVNCLIAMDNVNDSDWIESSKMYSKKGNITSIVSVDKNNIILDSKNQVLYFPVLIEGQGDDKLYGVIIVYKIDLKERVSTELAIHYTIKPSAHVSISEIKENNPEARKIGDKFIVKSDNFVKKGTTKPKFISIGSNQETSILQAYKLKTGKILSFDKQ